MVNLIYCVLSLCASASLRFNKDDASKINTRTLSKQDDPTTFFLDSVLGAIFTFVSNYIRVGSCRCLLSQIVVVPAIPFEIAFGGLENHFTPTVENKYLEVLIIDEEGEKFKALIDLVATNASYRTGRTEGIGSDDNRITFLDHFRFIGARAAKTIDQVNRKYARFGCRVMSD